MKGRNWVTWEEEEEEKEEEEDEEKEEGEERVEDEGEKVCHLRLLRAVDGLVELHLPLPTRTRLVNTL